MKPLGTVVSCKRVTKTDKGHLQGLGASLLLACFLCSEVYCGCKSFDFNITADDILILYVDGLPITGLPNARIWNDADTVKLSCATRVIAIQGINQGGYGGIRGSDEEGLIFTNSSWKCTHISYPDWEKVDFDDFNWPNAVITPNKDPEANVIPGIKAYSQWIWTEDFYIDKVLPSSNIIAYCRKRLEVDECQFGPPENQCNPTMGHCINTSTGYRCDCFQGYIKVDNHTCEDLFVAVSNDNKVNVSIILGAVLGASILVNVIFVILLVVYQRRKIQNSIRDQNGGGTGQPNVTSSSVDENPNVYEDLTSNDIVRNNDYEKIKGNPDSRNQGPNR